MKKTTKWILGIGAIVFLAGCSGTGKTASSESSASTSNESSESTTVEKVTLNLAAAASLEYAFEEKLIPLFEKEHADVTIQASYDSSGKLQTQIEEGMEADVFFSAATKQMNALEDRSFIDSSSVIDLLENKVVLIVPSSNPDNLSTFEDITKAETVAIGDPESVPAGQYAKEALTSLNLWEGLENKFSLGTNVTEVLNWVAEGSADAGIVYETDAKTTKNVKIIAEAPEGSLTEAIVYPIGILNKSENKTTSQEFLEFLQTEEASKIFEEYGFTPLK